MLNSYLLFLTFFYLLQSFVTECKKVSTELLSIIPREYSYSPDSSQNCQCYAGVHTVWVSQPYRKLCTNTYLHVRFCVKYSSKSFNLSKIHVLFCNYMYILKSIFTSQIYATFYKMLSGYFLSNNNSMNISEVSVLLESHCWLLVGMRMKRGHIYISVTPVYVV